MNTAIDGVLQLDVASINALKATISFVQSKFFVQNQLKFGVEMRLQFDVCLIEGVDNQRVTNN